MYNIYLNIHHCLKKIKSIVYYKKEIIFFFENDIKKKILNIHV